MLVRLRGTITATVHSQEWRDAGMLCDASTSLGLQFGETSERSVILGEVSALAGAFLHRNVVQRCNTPSFVLSCKTMTGFSLAEPIPIYEQVTTLSVISHITLTLSQKAASG